MPFSSYCQICALPLQHLCLVPAENCTNAPSSKVVSFLIYWDAASSSTLTPPVPFGVEHAWLCRAVVLREPDNQNSRPPLFGRVHEGDLRHSDDDDVILADIEDGVSSEGAAVHHACWELAGKPDSWTPTLRQIVSTSTAYQRLALEYQGQYFDFAKMVARNEDWMLQDPQRDDEIAAASRSRQRILELIKDGETASPESNDQENNADKAEELSWPPSPTLPDGFDGQTLYQLLAIHTEEDRRTVTPQTIERAFRRRQVKLHPNAVGGGDPPLFEQVRKARFILVRHRNEYDHCNFSNPADRQTFAYLWDRVSRNIPD